jgi:hypothetical protein
MVRLELIRFSSGEEATLGLLYFAEEGAFLAFTLEDEHREIKVPGETCIPEGTYRITLRTEGGFHQRYSTPGHWAYDIHKGMIWIRDVPGFQYILIHTGNRDEHTEGCILIGDGASQNVTEEGSLQASRAAYRRVYPQIAGRLENGEEGFITIRQITL